MNDEELEKVITLVAPERAHSTGGTRSSWEGSRYKETSITPSNKDEKPLPHYLRPSTGSCHDFCKYGRKHAFDVNKRQPVLPTFLSNNKFADEGNNRVKQEQRRLRLNKKTRSQAKAEKFKSNFSEKVLPPGKAKVMTKDLITVLTVNKGSEHAEGLPEETIPGKLIQSPPVEKRIVYDVTTDDQVQGSLQQPIDNMELAMSSRANGSIIPDGYDEFKQRGLARVSLDECIDPAGEITADADSNPASLTTGASKESSNTEVTSPSIKEISGSVDNIQIDGQEGSSEGSISMDLDNTPPNEIDTGECDVLPCKDMEECPKELKDTDVQTPTTTKEIVASRKSTKLTGHAAMPKSGESTNSKALSTPDKKEMVKRLNTGKNNKGEAIKLKPTRQMLLRDSKDKVLVQNGSDLSPMKKTVSPVKSKLSPRSEKKAFTSANPRMIKLKAASPRKKDDITSVSSFVLKKSSLPSVKNPIASTKPRVIKLKTTSPHKKSDFPSASSIMLKQRISLLKPTSSPVSGGLNTSSTKEEKNSDVRISAGKFSRTMLMKRRNTPASSQVKKNESSGNDENRANIKEKTLYVVSAKTVETSAKLMQQRSRNRKKSVSSESSPRASASPSGSSYGKEEDEDSESARTDVSGRKHITRSKVEDRRRVRRTPSGHAEAETPAPHKLKFRRGKVINPQAAENNVPRRLRFRQPRTIDQNRNAKLEAVNKTFMKKELEGCEMNGPAGLETPPSVVLRRQDHQQDKKDTKSLFNHVIEETASKLVETRKSKVKALVGAFETVISLQESKPASTV